MAIPFFPILIAPCLDLPQGLWQLVLVRTL
jgi:hypothetical protein